LEDVADLQPFADIARLRQPEGPRLWGILPQVTHVLAAWDARNVLGVIPLIDRIQARHVEVLKEPAQEGQSRRRVASQRPAGNDVQAAILAQEALAVRGIGTRNRGDPELMDEFSSAQMPPALGDVAL